MFVADKDETYKVYHVLITTNDVIFDGSNKEFNFYKINNNFDGYITLVNDKKEVIEHKKYVGGHISLTSKTSKTKNEAEYCVYFGAFDGNGGFTPYYLVGCYGSIGGIETGYGSSGGTGDNGDVAVMDPVSIVVNPCDQLKKMIDPTNTTNIKAQIDWLKSKVNALVNNKESGVEVQKRMNADETFRYEYTRIDSPNEFSVGLSTGGMNIGGIHSHPKKRYAMFSFQDVRFLLNAYDGASSTRSDDVFVMVVCKDNNGVTNTYNLKIDNIDALRNNVNSVWNDPFYSKFTKEDDKIKAIHKDQAKIYAKSNGELEKSFLDQFKDFGISLYKADATTSSFSKLALNNLKTVTSTPL